MIELKNVSFRYADCEGGVTDVNLKINQGECVLLIGPSGGGKTTITRLINGLAPSYYAGQLEGEVRLDGTNLAEIPDWKIGEDIGSVFQDPKSQFFSAELAGEVAFACENYGLAKTDIRQRTDGAIDAFKLGNISNRSLDVLSSGEKQRVAIASVYALGPQIYVCDEPTANLDETGAKQLGEALRQLKRAGNTIIIAEHRLAWLFGIVDRYIYISDGIIRWEKNVHQMQAISKQERYAYGLREISEKIFAQVPKAMEKASVALSAVDISCKRKKKFIFKKLSISIYSGIVTALVGANGTGKTSLALTLTGLWREKNGIIEVRGKKMSVSKRRELIWFSSNDTGTQFFTNSVTEEVLLGIEHSKEQLDKARELLKELGLYEYKDAHPATLSGGQKQRLSIACGILSNREIMIFDEPTSGLDGGNMNIIAEVLKREALRGKAILVITHDKELIETCCDNAIYMENEWCCD